MPPLILCLSLIVVEYSFIDGLHGKRSIGTTCHSMIFLSTDKIRFVNSAEK